MSIDTKLIGKTWPAFSYDVCKEKIREYAKAIKNPDPHYMDEEFARKSKYGCIIAPPTFCVVYGSQMIEPIFNIPMLVHGEQEFEFYEVVKAGDTVTSTAKVVNIVNKEKLDIIAIELLSRNQHGRDVCRGVYTFVVRK